MNSETVLCNDWFSVYLLTNHRQGVGKSRGWLVVGHENWFFDQCTLSQTAVDDVGMG